MNNAFFICKKLKNVDINNNIDEIGESAFEYCASLESINIKSHHVNFKTKTFYHCKKLKKAHISKKYRNNLIPYFSKKRIKHTFF